MIQTVVVLADFRMAFTTAKHDTGPSRGASAGLRLIIIAIICVALMVLDHQNRALVSMRQGLSLMVQPVIFLVSSPARLGNWLSDSFTTRRTLEQENRNLRRQMLAMSAQTQQMATLKTENARLRALLDSTAKLDDRVLIAEIVTVDMNPFRQSILINKGSADELSPGEALIDADGVIGQITRTQLHTSEALLITDLDHAVPVEVLRNRLRTIAVGTGEVERLSLPYLPRNADIVAGDILVTSGLGGTFPAGYPVATITDVRSTAGQPFLEIDATPSAMLNRIREVLVIVADAALENAAVTNDVTDNDTATDDAREESGN